MLRLETIEWFSKHNLNDKVIDCKIEPVAGFGCIVDRMNYILHTEPFFQHAVKTPWTNLPVEVCLRSQAMTDNVCISEGEREPQVFDQNSGRLLIDLKTMRERSDRRYNVYRFTRERERMWRCKKLYTQGDILLKYGI